MKKTLLIVGSLLLIIVIGPLLVKCDPRYGLLESEFQLSSESRIPRWFDVSGYDRKDLSMTMTYYSSPFGSKVKMKLFGPEHRSLRTKVGTIRWHPITERQGYDNYPLYSIITVDGISEVFEHKRRDDIQYITDDPKVTAVIKK